MKHQIDLTKGNIALELTRVSIPIMLTMFIQMAYNLTDMIWIGSIGSGAVAAIGTAGFFIWIGNALTFMPKVGLEVCVAQSVGKKDQNDLQRFMANGLLISLSMSVIFSLIVFIMANPLINFFKLGTNVNGFDPTNSAISYLRVISLGMVFSFINPCFTAVYNGLGNSKLPFYYNSAGLLVNVILDPLLIFGVWIFPKMGVQGAAIATVIAQLCVSILFIFSFRRHFEFVRHLKTFFVFSRYHLYRIIKIGFPPAAQSAMFALIAMVIARIIVRWGAIPIAVQRVGSQIESLSWMTASGFSTALSAFVGQNYGAKQYHRIWKGFLTAMYIMSSIGILVSLLLILFPEFLFKIFVREPNAIQEGIIYLTILGYSQLFMCLEITTAGAFNGLGKSLPPSIVSISLNLLRIPSALIFSALIGLNGIWWSISGSSILKGTILVLWFTYYFRKKYKTNNF
ncbi:MAG: MATE family efflux transporter [Candidatus Cloacimonetes bacterium]|nr:MATE family efflux transporter [Candidatus Cloacimonadota bacterium]